MDPRTDDPLSNFGWKRLERTDNSFLSISSMSFGEYFSQLMSRDLGAGYDDKTTD